MADDRLKSLSFRRSDRRGNELQNRSERNHYLVLLLFHNQECIIALDQFAFDQICREECDRHVFADEFLNHCVNRVK